MNAHNTENTQPFRLPDRAIRLLTEPVYFIDQVEQIRREQQAFFSNALEIAYESLEAEFLVWTGRRRYPNFSTFCNAKHYQKVMKPNRAYKNRKKRAA